MILVYQQIYSDKLAHSGTGIKGPWSNFVTEELGLVFWLRGTYKDMLELSIVLVNSTFRKKQIRYGDVHVRWLKMVVALQ